MTDIPTIAAGLSNDVNGFERRNAVLRAVDWSYARDLAPGNARSLSQGFLRKSGLFEIGYRHGFLQYRLNPLGLEVRSYLTRQSA